MNRDRAAARKALGRAAGGVRGRAAAAAGHPMEVQAQQLMAWALSEPDMGETIPFEELPLGRQVVAGTPVLLDGAERYIGLPLEGGPMAWPGRDALVEHSPVGLLLAGEPELDTDEEVLHRARKLVCLQMAANGHAPTLALILRRTGHEAAAAMVEEQDTEDWSMAPLGFPNARQLLEHAFAGEGMAWERAVLEQACRDRLADAWPAPPEGTALVPIPEG